MTAALLSVFLVGSAWAVQPAGPADVKKIERLIGAAKKVNDGIAAERARLIREEGPIPAPDFKGRLDKALAADRDRRDSLMREASDVALVAYGLVSADAEGNPIMPEGTIQDPILKQYGLKGSVTWKLIYQDPPAAERLVAPGFGVGKGRKKDLKVGIDDDEYRRYDASTVGDGYTVVWVNPVDPKTKTLLSPPALARLLHHELTHFKLETTARVGGPLGPNREEVEAYKEDLRVLGDFGFSPAEEASQRASLEKSRDNYQRQTYLDDTIHKFQSFSARLGGFIRGGHDVGVANLETSIPGLYISAETLNDIRARAREMDKKILAGQDERRRESARADEPQDGAPETGADPSPTFRSAPVIVPILPRGAVAAQLPQPAVAATLPRDRWKDLKGLAERGCSAPDGVSQAELDTLWPGFKGLPYSIGKTTEYGLDGCSANLFLRLLRMAADSDPYSLTVEVFLAAASAAAAPAVPIQDYVDPNPGSGRGSPSVPTCRYHPWCRDWNP